MISKKDYDGGYIPILNPNVICAIKTRDSRMLLSEQVNVSVMTAMRREIEFVV